MTLLKKSLGLLALSTLLGIFTSKAQETKGATDFGARIDSLVQSIFHRVDEQLGTYIFFDEPTAIAEDTDTLRDTDEDFATSRSKHSRYWRHRREASLYAFEPGRGIMRNPSVNYPWESAYDEFLFRYNRVEGFFLGLSSPKGYAWEGRHIKLFGTAGYGFAAHRWRYSGGVAQQFGTGGQILEVGAEGHSLTDTRDQWIISEGENTLAALFLRDDYRDYFGRKGFSVWTGLYHRERNSDLQFRLAFLNDRYESLRQSTDWAIFGGDKRFRYNPGITEGRMKSVLTTFEFHHARERRFFSSGWSTVLSAEFSEKGLGGDFDFNRYLVDLRGYLPLSDYDIVNIRLRVGSTTGEAPLQKAFDLGGLSTLPAFGFKEFVGNRLLLLNVEYVVNGKILDNAGLFPSWLLRNFNLIFFSDAGYVTIAPSGKSFLQGLDGLSSETIKWDWGFAIGSRDGKMRLGFAWRTDVSKPVKVFIRVSRPF